MEPQEKACISRHLAFHSPTRGIDLYITYQKIIGILAPQKNWALFWIYPAWGNILAPWLFFTFSVPSYSVIKPIVFLRIPKKSENISMSEILLRKRRKTDALKEGFFAKIWCQCQISGKIDANRIKSAWIMNHLSGTWFPQQWWNVNAKEPSTIIYCTFSWVFSTNLPEISPSF